MKLDGYLDHADRTQIRGWVRDLDDPQRPVSVIITANGELIARVLANTLREDLKAINDGNGRLSFDVDVDGRFSPLERYLVEARGEVTGEHLMGSPWMLEASNCFDGATKAAFSRLMASAETEDDFAERLTFLAAQTEALLQLSDRRRNRQRERDARDQLKWRFSGALGDAAAKRPQRTALVIDLRPPAVDRDAGSVAIMSHMVSLQRLGYAVSFLPTSLDRDTAPLDSQGIACMTRPWYATVEEALARNAGAFDVIYLHRAAVAAPYLLLLRRYYPKAKVVFSVAELSSLRLARQADVEERPELVALAQRDRAIEIGAGHHADAVITHSHEEAKLLRAHIAASKIHVVPWAVPIRRTETAFAERHGLAFIGGFAHQPNVDAAYSLATHIMPEIGRSDPSLPCLLVGSEMPDWLRAIVTPPMQAIGQVDDLKTVFERVRLTIAPLAYGAGIKGKVLASLAAGVPCVCTPVAAEGLALPPVLTELIAREPADLAAAALRLHNDEELNQRCAEAGLAYIASRMSDTAIDAAMTAVLA